MEAYGLGRGFAGALLESSLDAIVAVDCHGRVTEFSPVAQETFGWSRDQALGQEAVELLGLASAVEELALGERLETGARRRDGSEVSLELIAARVEGPGLHAYTLVMRDVSDRHDVLHDGLTGAAGRTLFMERLHRALSGRAHVDRLVGVLFVDVDRFKAVNDSFGHEAGDRLLVEIAHRIRSVIRPEDTLGRISGDEFTVLCEAIEDESDALALAGRLKVTAEAPVTIEGRRLRPTVSVGVALARGGHDTADAVLTDADSAMFRAKQRQHEGPVLFDEKLRTSTTERLRVEHELRDAIERDELVLHYQPQVSLLTGMAVGVEALVRWRHPTRGLLAPIEFIPHAEETGLIVPLGEVVLEKACAQAHLWAEMRPGDPPLTMSVNLSPAQLLSPTLLAAVECALEHSSLEPGSLCLEITERTLMVDGPATAASIAALSGMGIRLAIDDFGTGYSSLSYLRLLPVDSLKVDAIFVEGLGRRRDDKAIVGAVIDMAHALGMGVVAEGVESARQVSQLRELDCDQAQGYRFARPTPAGDLREVIRRPRPLVAAQTAGA